MTYGTIVKIASLALAASIASAHPPGADGHHDDGHGVTRVDAAHLRNWTNIATGEVVRGAYLASRDVDGTLRVSIERENGDVVVFALADMNADDQKVARAEIDAVKARNDQLVVSALMAAQPSTPTKDGEHKDGRGVKPPQAAPFDAFAPFVNTQWDDRFLYVESDGLPHMPGAKEPYGFSHTMMVGITAWQQQVPLPQHYRGIGPNGNAWRIPLQPQLADKPVSAKEQLFRGAIALAANGVPIFNPIKNDGRTDTFTAGELDEFGGHCGRADDYHYHIAPTHLQKFVGKNAPIAYALDGFAIYGLFDPAAKPGTPKACPLGSVEPLDSLNGHFAPGVGSDAKGVYHYHASTGYPYLNGGMRGVVTVKDDQIDPQPRATPVRDWLQPLRGAKITGFAASGKANEPGWSLTYTQGGKRGFVNYAITTPADDKGNGAAYRFEFITPDGNKTTQTYNANQRPAGGGGKGRDEGERRRGRENAPPPRRDEEQPKVPRAEDAPPAVATAGFTLKSPDVTDGRLSVECTCDAAGGTRAPTLSWGEPPAGTAAFAFVMHHVPPDGDTHVYMVVANVPAAARELKSTDKAVGVWGVNTVNRRAEYAPPCSQGPGDKTYTITLYALSAEAKVDAGMTRDALLAAIKDTTLAVATLPVTYARQVSGTEKKEPRNDQPGGKGERRGQGKRGERAQNPPDEPQGGLIARMTAFKTDVPSHEFDVILARPTDHTITVSVATARAAADAKPITGIVVEHWPATAENAASAILRVTTIAEHFTPGGVTNVELTGLSPGSAYRYRVGLKRGDGEPQWQPEASFRTRRPMTAPGKTDQRFTFVVQADSHLDSGVEPAMYERTLANMLEAKPDFMIDLGDTFMTDKRGREFKAALPQYDAQRWYFSRVAHAAPLFMVLGNHDGEKGSSGRDADDIGPWSFTQRTQRFPAPVIDGTMYTGATTMANGAANHYYAFEWGDALFIVLDPFWSTTDRIRGGGGGGGQGGRGPGNAGEPNGPDGRRNSEPVQPNDASWEMTLGRAQYDWLARTLESTKSKHRFVFIHHLVGGKGGPEARGGVESSRFFEWGGQNADGTPGFAAHRPGWPMPIHDLLVKHRVSAVFHGHDHLYVHSERDGVQYQCVPQPGNPVGNTRSAAEYGYASGTTFGSPGHVRVRVGPDEAVVEFVRSAIAGLKVERGGRDLPKEENGAVVDRYSIAARKTTPQNR